MAKAFVFRAPATTFAALRGGGIDVASMANNHGLDYGVEGLRAPLRGHGTQGEGARAAGARNRRLAREHASGVTQLDGAAGRAHGALRTAHRRGGADARRAHAECRRVGATGPRAPQRLRRAPSRAATGAGFAPRLMGPLILEAPRWRRCFLSIGAAERANDSRTRLRIANPKDGEDTHSAPRVTDEGTGSGSPIPF